MENKEKYLFYKEDSFELYNGKMQDVLSTFEENSIDSIVCDPPYELNFMGKGWDNSGVAFQKETWEHCFKVLKPGGYLLAFGGTRTFHRICCAIEDAGFEIRDCIMYLYGSGFPKSMNIGLALDKKNGVESIDTGVQSPNARPNSTKNNTLYESGTVGKEFTIKKANNDWDGWGTTLKPAYEPVIVARKPFNSTLLENIETYGVGGLNIDECRVGNEKFVIEKEEYDNNENQSCYGNIKRTPKEYNGRFPANVITDGSEEVAVGMPISKSSGGKTTMPNFDDSEGGHLSFGQNYNVARRIESDYIAPKDEGSAIRYFYSAKASKKDRDEGLDMFIEKSKYAEECGGNRKENGKSIMEGSNVKVKNFHPTVKPVELMQYLVRLVSPKNSVVLDCFMGSGSTGKACMFENRERQANYHFIGIEMTNEYLPICQARIDYAKYKFEYEEKKEKEERLKKGIISLFDDLEDIGDF